jgi:hypothetical protein
MSYQIFGKIHRKSDTLQVSDKFAKREFVVKTDEQYPQFINIELHQDSVDLLDPINVGDNVTVSVNLRGRGWKKDDQSEEKFFNTVQAWKIERSAADINTPKPASPPEQAQAFNNQDDDEPDDLPF